MSSECTDCVAELDHCHGTFVTHLDGGIDCTEGCPAPDHGKHELSITCDVIPGGCFCTQIPALAAVA